MILGTTVTFYSTSFVIYLIHSTIHVLMHFKAIADISIIFSKYFSVHNIKMQMFDFLF